MDSLIPEDDDEDTPRTLVVENEEEADEPAPVKRRERKRVSDTTLKRIQEFVNTPSRTKATVKPAEQPKEIGLGGTVKEGFKSTARALGAAADTYQGDEAEVVEAAKVQKEAKKDPRLAGFLSAIEDHKKRLGPDPSLWESIKAVGSAAIDNPSGAALMVAEQIPNSLAALGSAGAGALAGGAIGGPVGAAIGGFAGLAGANVSLETGHKALEAAAGGTFSPEEQSRVKGEGGTKGLVVSGVDALTLGATKFITGASKRAVEAATKKTLADQGIDVADAAAVKTALADPAIMATVNEARKVAADASSKLGRRIAQTGGALALETIGEGVGEFVGEFAATGKADVVDAVVESLAGLSQSMGEVAFTSALNKRAENRLFKTEEAAQKAAETDTENTGVEHEVKPHPVEPEKFVAVPKSRTGDGVEIEQNELGDILPKAPEAPVKIDPKLEKKRRKNVEAFAKDPTIIPGVDNIPAAPETPIVNDKPVTGMSDSALKYSANHGSARVKQAAQAEIARRKTEGVDPKIANAVSTPSETVDHIIKTGAEKAQDEAKGPKMPKPTPAPVKPAKAQKTAKPVKTEAVKPATPAAPEKPEPVAAPKIPEQNEVQSVPENKPAESVPEKAPVKPVPETPKGKGVPGLEPVLSTVSHRKQQAGWADTDIDDQVKRARDIWRGNREATDTDVNYFKTQAKRLEKKGVALRTDKYDDTAKFFHDIADAIKAHKTTPAPAAAAPEAKPEAKAPAKKGEANADLTKRTVHNASLTLEQFTRNERLRVGNLHLGEKRSFIKDPKKTDEENAAIDKEDAENAAIEAEEIRRSHLDWIETALEEGHEVPKTAVDSHSTIDAKEYPLAAKLRGKGKPESQTKQPPKEKENARNPEAKEKSTAKPAKSVPSKVKKPKFSRGESSGLAKANVQSVVNAVKGKWKNAPEVVVLDSMDSAPLAARAENLRQLSQGATGEPEGFIAKGKVYIVASQMQTPGDVVRVMLHETLGHFGLRGVFGQDLNKVLKQVSALRRRDVEAKAKQYGLDIDNESDRLTAAEEVLAEMAQTNPQISLVQRAFAVIRTWLRNNIPGFEDLQLSDAEIIQDILIPARQFVQAGRFQGITGNVAFFRSLRSKKETLEKFGLKPKGRYKTREIAAALEARQREKHGIIGRKDRSDKAKNAIAEWMVDEVRFEMEHPKKSGVGWYSHKFQRALDIMATEFPEIATEKHARDLLTALIAITSDGQKVVPNFAMAADLYGNFRKTGKFTTERGHARQASINNNTRVLQKLHDTMGPDEMRAYLMEELTVSELKAIAKTAKIKFSSSYQPHIKLPRAAIVLGPKLGAFYANLMGSSGYLTMDRWWSRTFNRYRGTLLDAPTRQGLNRFKELMGDPSMSDDEVLSAVVGPRDSYKAKKFKNGTEIEKAANTIYKAAFENIEDAPFNTTDRTFMLESVALAQKKLAEGGVQMSVADIQAVLWYYEKRLYGELGARQTADVSYEEAAKRVIEARAAGAGGSGGQSVPGVRGEESIDEPGRVGDDDYEGVATEAASADRVTFSRSTPAATPTPLRERIDKIADTLIYNFQDRFKPLKDIQERAGPVDEDADASLAEERYSGMVRARTDTFEEQLRDPLLKAIHDSGVAYEDVEEYLHALHAPSRNKAMQEINPTADELEAQIDTLTKQRDSLAKDPDVAEFLRLKRELRQAEADIEDGMADESLATMIKGEMAELRKIQNVKDFTAGLDKLKGLRLVKPFVGDNTALSGMSNDEAAAVLAKIDKNGTRKALEKISGIVDTITSATRQIYVDSGLEKADVIEAWNNKYEHYIPLHRDEVSGSVMPKTGQGFNIRGRESKRATGSNKEVTNILAHVVAQHEAAIVRSEKARVDRALFRFAQLNPDPELWTLDVAPMVRDVDRTTGFVVSRVDPTYKNKPEVLTLKIDGEEHTITFNEKNLEAMRLAASMKNMSAEQLGEVTAMVGKFTRFLAQMNTTMNPVFTARNFLRDLQTAFVNLSDTAIADKKREVFKAVPAAIKGMWDLSKGKHGSQWAKYAEEFKNAGGQTGWMDHYKDIGERADTLRKELAVMGPGKLNFTRQKARALFDIIQDANGAVENGVRLSAYVSARKAGMSEGRAAQLAKNLTVNFNTHGARGTEINAWYMFMNASVQGTARLVKALSNRQVQKIVAGVVLSGFLMDILARSLAGDADDDGENDYDQLPEHTKAMNFVLWVGDRPVTIPQPYGYNFFASTGRKISEIMFRENYSAAKSAADLAGVFLDAFSPTGQAGSLLQYAAPTVVDPFVQWSENRNFAGNPLRRAQNPFGVPNPEYQMGFKSTSAPAKWLAQVLNDETGGNEVRPGYVNVNPVFFDFTVSSIAGGAGRTVLQTLSAPLKAGAGDELQAREIPFLNIFLGARPEFQTERKYFEAIKKVETAKKELKTYRDKGDLEMVRQIREEHGEELRLIAAEKATKKILERLRKREHALDKRDVPNKSELRKKIEDERRAAMSRFNKRYREAVAAD